MSGGQTRASWRKPSGPVKWLMIGIASLWLVLAIAVNWGPGAYGKTVFGLMVGSSTGVMRGQLWRLLTASVVHAPDGLWGILIALLMLYFFATPLAERWPTRRLLLFLFGSAAFAYLVESISFSLFPTIASGTWFGAMAMADAAIVAWALGARGEVVHFYFVIPMKPIVMVGLMVGFHVLQVITLERSSSGVFAPFAAMASGWLLSDQSPLRRMYLKLKLRKLQGEVESMTRKARVKRASHLRVVPPTKKGDDDDDEPMLH
jgi:membrane associated rhomboid family serine protease